MDFCRYPPLKFHNQWYAGDAAVTEMFLPPLLFSRGRNMITEWMGEEWKIRRWKE